MSLSKKILIKNKNKMFLNKKILASKIKYQKLKNKKMKYYFSKCKNMNNLNINFRNKFKNNQN